MRRFFETSGWFDARREGEVGGEEGVGDAEGGVGGGEWGRWGGACRVETVPAWASCASSFFFFFCCRRPLGYGRDVCRGPREKSNWRPATTFHEEHVRAGEGHKAIVWHLRDSAEAQDATSCSAVSSAPGDAPPQPASALHQALPHSCTPRYAQSRATAQPRDLDWNEAQLDQ